MPELPEVEILRRYFAEVALQREIAGPEFYDELNKIFASPRDQLVKTLTSDHFISTRRTGKYLFTELSRGMWLHLHFGMTGDLQLLNPGDELPKYTRFVIRFTNGERLAFRDLRKFGVIELINSPEQYQRERKIGQDLLEMEPAEFINAFKGRQAPIKSLLLQQDKVAGIGNWIADEMLFDAGIHPETRAAALSEQEIRTLYIEALRIVRTAIDKDTHYGDFPKGFFVNYRKKDAIHPNHPDSPVQSLKVGGRGTFIVSEKQVRK